MISINILEEFRFFRLNKLFSKTIFFTINFKWALVKIAKGTGRREEKKMVVNFSSVFFAGI